LRFAIGASFSGRTAFRCGEIMNIIRTALAAGGLVFMAGSATALTTDLTFNGFENGSRNIYIDAKIGGTDRPSKRVAAGAFSMSGTNPEETFVAWCMDILSTLQTGPVTYAYQGFLTGDSLARVQKVFDANYILRNPLGSAVNSAAFQVSIWDAIYDTDWDAGANADGGDGFRMWGDSDVLSLANDMLADAEAYEGAPIWSITQLDSEVSQSLGRATFGDNELTAPVPVPASVLLLASAFAGAGLFTARARRRAG
jgi:hypothetical protein